MICELFWDITKFHLMKTHQENILEMKLRKKKYSSLLQPICFHDVHLKKEKKIEIKTYYELS